MIVALHAMSKRARKSRPRQPVATNRGNANPVAAASADPVVTDPAPTILRVSKRTHLVVAVVLVMLCAALFGPALDYPMVFDDVTYLIDNPVFVPESYSYPLDFKEFIQRPGKLGTDPDFAINFVMRPVAYASFFLNRWIDGYNPRWYRVLNIAIHAGNAMLIYGLLVLLRTPKNRDRLGGSSATFIAAATAVLFAVHPLAIESVTYIVQRFTSLAALFCLLALWLHFLAVRSTPRTRSRWILRGGSVLSMLLAMQTKECSFTIPVMAVVLDRFVLGSQWRDSLRRSLPLLLCMPLIPALVLLSSSALHESGFDFSAGMNIVNSRDEPIPQLHYLATQITVVLHYLRLMVWPVGLNLDPEWPLYRSFFATPVLLAFSALAALVLAAAFIFKRLKTDPRAALVLAFTAWYFVTISVSSSLIPLPDMVAEHRSYLPSVGVFVILACLGDWLRQVRLPAAIGRFALPLAAVLALSGLAWKTNNRNNCWSSTENLWRDTAAKSPGKFRVWGNLGAAVSDAGKDKEAVTYFKKSVELEPRFQNGLLNLSNSYLRLNLPHESLKTSQKLIELSGDAPLKAPVAYTVGISLYGVGRFEEARRMLCALAETAPGDPMVHRALAYVYVATKQPHLALDHLRTYARLDPDAQDAEPMIARLQKAINRSSGS